MATWAIPELNVGYRFAVREYDKQNFRVFLGTIYLGESSSATVGEIEASGI